MFKKYRKSRSISAQRAASLVDLLLVSKQTFPFGFMLCKGQKVFFLPLRYAYDDFTFIPSIIMTSTTAAYSDI